MRSSVLCVQDQVVVCAACCQLLHFVPAGRLITPREKPHQSCVICKFDDGIAVMGGGIVMCLQFEEQGAHHTALRVHPDILCTICQEFLNTAQAGKRKCLGY